MSGSALEVLESFLAEALVQTLHQRTWRNDLHPLAASAMEDFRHSAMHFKSAQLNGSIILSVSCPLLQETCPGFSEAGENRELYLEDWIGELSNLLLGRVKSKLLPFGVVLSLGPPRALKQAPFESELHSMTRPWCLALEDGRDRLQLHLSVTIEPQLDLGCVPDVNPNSLQPGDAVFKLGDQAGGKIRRYDMVYKVRSGVSVEEDQDPEGLEEIYADDYSSLPSRYVPSKGSASHAAITSASGSTPQNFSTQALKLRSLMSVSWLQDGALSMHFSESAEYRFIPEALLSTRTEAQLWIEGFEIIMRKEEGRLKIEIPAINMKLSRSLLPS